MWCRYGCRYVPTYLYHLSPVFFLHISVGTVGKVHRYLFAKSWYLYQHTYFTKLPVSVQLNYFSSIWPLLRIRINWIRIQHFFSIRIQTFKNCLKTNFSNLELNGLFLILFFKFLIFSTFLVPGFGSTDPIESGSDLDPDLQHCSWPSTTAHSLLLPLALFSVHCVNRAFRTQTPVENVLEQVFQAVFPSLINIRTLKTGSGSYWHSPKIDSNI